VLGVRNALNYHAAELPKNAPDHPAMPELVGELRVVAATLENSLRADLARTVAVATNRNSGIDKIELDELTFAANRIENIGRRIQSTFGTGPAAYQGAGLVRHAQHLRKAFGYPAGSGPDEIQTWQRPASRPRAEAPPAPPIPYDREASQRAQKENMYRTFLDREQRAAQLGHPSPLGQLFTKYPQMGEGYQQWKRRQQ